MNRVCTVSDLHLGCHCDSEHWHDIALEWGKWLKDQLILENIEDMIICGDFFDNRNEIGVKTISVASELMDIWNDFNITIIAGNHDLFYKNRTDVNSVSIFKGRNNVRVIHEMTRETIGDKEVTFIPWNQDLSNCKKCDIIFGHLEINGFKMMPGRIAEGKTAPKSLTSRAKLIFSGHFHLRDERKYSKSEIIYVGSPYQINWGESSNVPGFYIVDIDDMSYEFFENTVSPKHIKIKSSDLDLDAVDGNIISVEFDSTLDDDTLEAIKCRIYEQNPLEIKFNMPKSTYNSNSSIECSDNVNIVETMMKFVDDLNVEEFSDDIKVRLKELYDKFSK